MTTSEQRREGFVWVWLPGAREPVVAGRLEAVGDLVEFNYGRSYLARREAIPLYLPELPLRPGRQIPLDGLRIAECIKDAGPDAWGQRVIMRHLLGAAADEAVAAVLDPLTYLMRSGSDRIGALDFQDSPTTYVRRDDGTARLEDLLQAADLVDRHLPLPPALDRALLHGSSVGGARPKALLRDGDRSLIDAKATLRELFSRITFNILVGNTDDHARNHAAFWDGAELRLTPAYDICPQGRSGGEAAQAMAIRPDGFRFSRLDGCVRGAGTYLLGEAEARAIIDHQIGVIVAEWADVTDRAGLTDVDRDYFWRRQFLNRYALQDYEGARVP